MRGISREFAEKGTGFADSGGFHVGEVDGYGEDENFPIGDVADFARETEEYRLMLIARSQSILGINGMLFSRGRI